jgi:hypothetical protein
MTVGFCITKAILLGYFLKRGVLELYYFFLDGFLHIIGHLYLHGKEIGKGSNLTLWEEHYFYHFTLHGRI